MSLQGIINSISDFNGPNETTHEKIYSILSTLHNIDPIDFDASQMFDVYNALGYSISSTDFDAIWDRYFALSETGQPYTPVPSDVEFLNPDDPITLGLLPMSTYPIPLDGRVLYEITCYNKETKEYFTYKKIIDFIEGDTLNDTDELLREEIELSPCDDVEINLIGGWSQAK